MKQPVNPNGCRWCGIDKRGHGRQFIAPAGWHTWEPPTQAQIKARMLARRSDRQASADCGWNPVNATTTCDWDPNCLAHGQPQNHGDGS